MSTGIKDIKDARVDDICDLDNKNNETSNTLQNTSSNFWNDIIFHNDSNSDNDTESENDSVKEIDNDIRTFKNVDSKHSEANGCDISVIRIKMRSDLFNDNSQQDIDLTNVDNNNHGELTEHFTEKNHENRGTSIKLFYPFQIKSEESTDKHVSNRKEPLSPHQDISHSSYTKSPDRQVIRSLDNGDISSQKINYKTTVENTENLNQNREDCKPNNPMIIIQENQRILSDDKGKIRKLNHLSNDSYLIENRDNKILLKRIGKMKGENIEVRPDIPNMDEQGQQHQLPEGWKRETVRRSRKTKMDVYYVSPTGIRLRSEAEVYQYCEQEGLKLDFSIFDFGYEEESDISDSDSTFTLSEEDSADDQVVRAPTGHSTNRIQRGTKRRKESSANSQMSKRIYLGNNIVLTPKVIPHELTVNAQRGLPEFLKKYTVLCYEDYLGFRTKEQFWQEPFMKRIYQAIDDHEMTIAEASELVDVQYSTLTYEYTAFMKNPRLTDASSENLGETEDRISDMNQVESSSQNKRLEPIKAASPDQIIPSTSRPGASILTNVRVSCHKSRVPANLYPQTDLDLRIKKCSCKKSQCLKQSCECFNNFQQCINCKCKCCHNKDEDPKREVALRKRLRKMYPSLSKDLTISNAATMAAAVALEEVITKGKCTKKKKSIHGCTCLKTACDKRHCRCYAAGLNCSDACLCIKCSNKITGNSIFNNMHPTLNMPLNSSKPLAPKSIIESVKDTIQRLFPQAYPKLTTDSSSSRLNDFSKGVYRYILPKNHTAVIGSSGLINLTSDRSSTMNNSMGIIGPAVISSKQPKSKPPSISTIKGFENKEAFLSKWVDANFKIDKSHSWEENLIVRHLRNTIERLGLKHIITISQLRKTMRDVFGCDVGPNKSLHYSPWMYAGIKPVLAYQGGQGNDIYTASTSRDTPNTPSTILSTENHDKSFPATFDDDEDLRDLVFRPVISEVSGVEAKSNALPNSLENLINITDEEEFTPVISEISGGAAHSQSTAPTDSSKELIDVTEEEEFTPVISEVSGGDAKSKALTNSSEKLINITEEEEVTPIISELSGGASHSQSKAPLYLSEELIDVSDEEEFTPVISEVSGGDEHSQSTAPPDSSEKLINITDDEEFTPVISEISGGDVRSQSMDSRDTTEEIINITDDEDDDESQTDHDYCPTISKIIGGDKRLPHFPNSTWEKNYTANEQSFFPIIEDVYSEPDASQTSRPSPTALQEESTEEVQLLGGTGSLKLANNLLVVPPIEEVCANVALPDASLITNPSESTVARTVEVGVRVQRGPDWIHCEEDGNGIGTVTKLSKKGTVKVVWDSDKTSEGKWYNMGLDGEYRLQPADEAPRLTVPELLPSSMLVRPPDVQMNTPTPSLLSYLPTPVLGNSSFSTLPILPNTMFYFGSTS